MQIGDSSMVEDVPISHEVAGVGAGTVAGTVAGVVASQLLA